MCDYASLSREILAKVLECLKLQSASWQRSVSCLRNEAHCPPASLHKLWLHNVQASSQGYQGRPATKGVGDEMRHPMLHTANDVSVRLQSKHAVVMPGSQTLSVRRKPRASSEFNGISPLNIEERPIEWLLSKTFMSGITTTQRQTSIKPRHERPAALACGPQMARTMLLT